MDFTDHGKQPHVFNIEELTLANPNFRTAIWTGEHLQMTLMSVEVGGEVGMEVHPDNDQFFRIEQGEARVITGDAEDHLTFEAKAKADFGIFVPAGTWHNIINIGDTPLKLYTIYGPAHHAPSTVHETKAIADAAEAAEDMH